MLTTLEVVCAAFGFQGGTIHGVKQRFAIASLDEMDRVCGRLADTPVTDPETKLYFMHKRNAAIKLDAVLGRSND